MFKRKIMLSFIALLMVFTCTSCKVASVEIAVTTYPIQYLVERIGGNSVNVVNISQDGAIQSAQIRENYEKILEKSRVLFYIPGLEPYFDVHDEILRSEDVRLMNLSSNNIFNEFQRYTTTSADGKTAIIEGPYYDGNIFNNIDVYKEDPMLWMDPITLISAAEIIRDYLIENFPEYRNSFKDNYDSLEMDLTRLDMEYRELKKLDSSISFVCMTPSFGPWQKSYGIGIYPICLSKYGALPSSDQLAVMKQKIIDDDVRYIAYEPNINDDMKKLYEELKNELDLETIELSNLSSLSETQKKENKDYLTIMYENLSVLEKVGSN